MAKKKQTEKTAAKKPKSVKPSESKPKRVRQELRLKKKRAFLAAFAETGNMELASVAAGCSIQIVYVWLKNDPEFVEGFKESKERAILKMEAEARRRAVDGVKRLKFTKSGEMICIPDPSGATEERQIRVKKGKQFVTEVVTVPKMIPYVEHEYSDTLMIFLLKSLRPEIYRERLQVDSNNKNLNANVDVPLVPGSQSQLPSRDELIAEMERLLLDLKGGQKQGIIEGQVLLTNGHTNGAQH